MVYTKERANTKNTGHYNKRQRLHTVAKQLRVAQKSGFDCRCRTTQRDLRSAPAQKSRA
jgi:hypothetical protein